MDELTAAVNDVNNDDSIHGLLVQSPLPDHLNEIEVQRLVSPKKDVDCFHPENVGLMYIGQPRFYPCTAGAVLEMLLRYDIDPAGKHAVIIGRSVLVGRPLAIMMASYGRGGNATVTLCHSKSTNIEVITRTADILIPAVGVAELVKRDWVKPGAVIVDVGINRVSDSSKKSGYRLVGDVAFEEVEPISSAIAPVPGGVGPMTVAMLSRNLMMAAGLDVGV
jgi:methylenetetrahydrofolate dehydrogenase (NADP+)/methenyltetrahydrofolate cyclohydrolase